MRPPGPPHATVYQGHSHLYGWSTGPHLEALSHMSDTESPCYYIRSVVLSVSCWMTILDFTFMSGREHTLYVHATVYQGHSHIWRH